VILETAAQEQTDTGPGSLRDLRRGEGDATPDHDHASRLHRHHAAQHAGGGVGVVEFERTQFALPWWPMTTYGPRRAAADLASTAPQLDPVGQAAARAACLDLIWAALLIDASPFGLDPHRRTTS